MSPSTTSRREFLGHGAATLAGLATAGALPSGAWALAGPRAERSDGRTLVLVELTGGNDGLNTVVPVEDDLYHRRRPSLRIAGSEALRIADGLALAPQLKGLQQLFLEGRLTVVQGVGMESPDRSHFTSLDRWHSADADRPRGTGWLARALSGTPSAGQALQGLALGDHSLPLVLRGAPGSVIACSALEELIPPDGVRKLMRSRELRKLDAMWGNAEEKRLASRGHAFLASLKSVQKARREKPLAGSSLARGLEDILRTLLGGLHVPAFFVRMGGFDTHARQKAVHGDLLAAVDGSLHAFHRALVRHHLEKRVLVMVYSEFGRRVAENGSAGTDHGAAAPVFLLGTDLPGGVHGSKPDLEDLVDGDVRSTLDFRRPLAQCLKHLRHERPAAILGPEGTPLF